MTPVLRARTAVEARLRRSAPARRQRWALAAGALERAARPAQRLLDAGCEDGLLTRDLAVRHPDWTVVGLDVVPSVLAQAAAEARNEGVRNVVFVQGDVTRPPVAGGFDAVLALECLAEIPDDVAAAAGLAAALRPGGTLVAHVPTADWRPVLPGAERRWRREVRHGYTPPEVTRLLEGAGFRDVRLRGTKRGTATLAQDVRDRYKSASGWVRAALHPVMVAAAAADSAGVTWGRPGGFLVTATRA